MNASIDSIQLDKRRQQPTATDAEQRRVICQCSEGAVVTIASH